MKKTISYTVEEEVANAVRKILEKIAPVDMKGTYDLTDREVDNIQTYLDCVVIE